mmetsp:Transcript_39244/g.88205  ORF Transcript_39244/g.88205 Transcript_39244/m.88205 type:complete len:397 (+) Transcript_39244:2140-3330(+)
MTQQVELNGAIGEIVDFDEGEGRWEVWLEENRATVWCRPQKLAVIDSNEKMKPEGSEKPNAAETARIAVTAQKAIVIARRRREAQAQRKAAAKAKAAPEVPGPGVVVRENVEEECLLIESGGMIIATFSASGKEVDFLSGYAFRCDFQKLSKLGRAFVLMPEGDIVDANGKVVACFMAGTKQIVLSKEVDHEEASGAAGTGSVAATSVAETQQRVAAQAGARPKRVGLAPPSARTSSATAGKAKAAGAEVLRSPARGEERLPVSEQSGISPRPRAFVAAVEAIGKQQIPPSQSQGQPAAGSEGGRGSEAAAQTAPPRTETSEEEEEEEEFDERRLSKAEKKMEKKRKKADKKQKKMEKKLKKAAKKEKKAAKAAKEARKVGRRMSASSSSSSSSSS